MNNNEIVIGEKYDSENIFAKILDKKIPADIVYEDDYTLAFKDINPQAKIHVLIIPKIKCQNITELLNADQKFLVNFMNGLKQVINKINPNNKDFKLITNNGPDAGQEVFHMHFHLMI